MELEKVLDQYPWSAQHESAVSTVADYAGIEFEWVLLSFDQLILNKVAKDKLDFPKAA